MLFRRIVIAFAAFLSSTILSSGTAHASSLAFGVIGSLIDMSASVSEAILPGGTIFQDSKSLFGTEPTPTQSTELLHLSDTGVNASGRSSAISAAFASSLAESNGNGGVGVSQTIFGSPGPNPGANVVRQLAAQALWTQTFVYNGVPNVSITLHLSIPALQVQLIGVPPNRDNPSFTETATASARVDTVIMHADGTSSKGGSFEFGLNEFETQIPDGTGTFLNFSDVDLIGTDAALFATLRPNFVGAWNIDAVSTDVKLGVLHTGDTLSYVYTLTAAGTTHGFERGYDAFLGDPFGADVVRDNLGVTVALDDGTPPGGEPAVVPEPSTWVLLLIGLAGILMRCSRASSIGITRVWRERCRAAAASVVTTVRCSASSQSRTPPRRRVQARCNRVPSVADAQTPFAGV